MVALAVGTTVRVPAVPGVPGIPHGEGTLTEVHPEWVGYHRVKFGDGERWVRAGRIEVVPEG